jgi:hypothetical protein
MKSVFNWWLKAIAVSFRRAIAFSRNKALTGASIAVLGLVLQWLILGKPWHEVGYSLLIVLVSFGVVSLAVGAWNVIALPAEHKVKLQADHSLALAEKDKALKEKQEQVDSVKRELQEFKDQISAVPFSFRTEVDTSGLRTTMVVDIPTLHGDSQRFHILVPPVSFFMWKKPSSQDLEVYITEYSLDDIRSFGRPPTFPTRLLIRDAERVDITERLVRFIAGDPFNHDRLLHFCRDVKAVLGYEILGRKGETPTHFRVTGKLNAGTLQLEIEHLPNPPSSTTGQ